MGVTECDNMLMLLGVSNKMSEKVRGHVCRGIHFGINSYQRKQC